MPRARLQVNPNNLIRARILLLALLLPTVARAADIDTIRASFVDYYTAAGADRSSARMQEALGALEANTRYATAPGFLLSDGTWSDINYKDVPSGSWSPWDHTRRLIVMAKAYRTPGQPYYNDPVLLGQIDAALGQVKTFYGATIIPTGNWWFWTIGIPIDLGPTLVLMRGSVNQKTVDELVTAIAVRIGSNPAQRGIIGPVPVGENLVWSSFTHLYLALMKDDPAMLAQVRDAMAGVTLPSATAEGMKPDASFHQHGAQLYTGGYGGAFAYDVARYALITRGTAYALPARSLAAFSDYIADGIAWSLYGNHFDVSVIGREVARPTTSGANGVAALLQTALIDTPRSGEIRSAAARMLQSWTWTFPVELAGLAARVESSRYAAAWPEGNRHYPWSDYTVHRRAGWFASVKMFSTRTKSGEKTNNENILGARQSDGRFHLSLTGDEYFNDSTWPALDWSRLPGITVEKKADAASAVYGFGTRSYAGGTSDGRAGVSAMELAPLGSTLIAKKSWFFFDDAIVFLTNGITATGTNRVETIVNQWPLSDPTAPLAGNGTTWTVADRIGYWFPTPTLVTTTRESRSGTWAALGGSTDTTPRQKTFLTLYIDHGVAPVNARAEYVIVPNVTPAAMQSWIASSPLTILANNGITSAVRNNRDGATGIAFWSAGSVDGIQSDTAAVVYTKMVGTKLHVWFADPNHLVNGSTRITVPGRYSTTDVAATAGESNTTMTIPRSGGNTVHVVLNPLPVKRRATSR